MKNKEDDACVNHRVVVKIVSFKDALNAHVVLKQFFDQRLPEAMSFIESHVHAFEKELEIWFLRKYHQTMLDLFFKCAYVNDRTSKSSSKSMVTKT
jgi:hypothetical protein